MATDSDTRGGRLAAYVLYLTDQTELVFASIDAYVWGLVNWMKLQRQGDPRLGVEGWVDFMQSVKVLTWVPHEPRKEIPLEYIKGALESVNRDVLWEVQTAFCSSGSSSTSSRFCADRVLLPQELVGGGGL